MVKNNVHKAHCNNCQTETNHDILATRKTNEEEYIESIGYPVIFTTEYKMLECRGCGSCSLEKISDTDFSNDYDYEYFPPRIYRKIPVWLNDLPSDSNFKDIKELFIEIYEALHSSTGRLAIMGARTLVEIFMHQTVGDIGGFNLKLDALEKKGYLGKKDKNFLATVLDAGHAVIHRGHSLSPDNISLVMDIVERLIHTIILEIKSSKLENETPKRKK